MTRIGVARRVIADFLKSEADSIDVAPFTGCTFEQTHSALCNAIRPSSTHGYQFSSVRVSSANGTLTLHRRNR